MNIDIRPSCEKARTGAESDVQAVLRWDALQVTVLGSVGARKDEAELREMVRASKINFLI